MLNTDRLRRSLILILAVLSSAYPIATVSAGVNGWTQFGLAGEAVNSIAISNEPAQMIFAGTDDGVFAYSGGTWNHSLAGIDTYSMVIGQGLYAGTGTGIWKSMDDGNTWNPVNTGLPGGTVLALVIDPSNSSTLYAGMNGSGVYKTTNGGGNWTAVNSGLTNLVATCLAINPLNPSILYAGTPDGVFQTWDGGGSWEPVSIDPNMEDMLSLAIDPVDPSNVYAGSFWSVFKSENGGATWSEASTGMTYLSTRALAVDPVTPTTLYAGTYLGYVYKSWNGGDTWTVLYSGGLSNFNVNALIFNPLSEANVYAGTENGVYDLEQTPDPFGKSAPADGANAPSNPVLSWGISSGADDYEYCYDTTNNGACDVSWVNTGSNRNVALGGLIINATYYWQVRSTNNNGTEYATGGNWWRFKVRSQTFADVPVDHSLWQYIEAFHNAGITTGCGVSPLIFCPQNPVTRASMAVFLLRAKYGSGYAPPPASHYFSDLPVPGKEWQEAWVDQLYREGITGGCGTSPLIYCPENATTRAAMAVFILRAKYGSSYMPPPASHYFADMPTAGKEWMEPWVDALYRQGVTTGCGTGPLIYGPETPVKRQAMAAFIVRAFNLPLP